MTRATAFPVHSAGHPDTRVDRVAKAGLRYTQFHSTALCSPTRAALITGRNHHSMGFGVISELSTGYPGYNSVMSPEKASIGRTSGRTVTHVVVRQEPQHAGLSAQHCRALRPMAVGDGLRVFYGFMGGETDQWTPFLFRDHTQIFPWIGRKDYNLTTDLADEAIKHMRDLNAAAPTNRSSFITCPAAPTTAPAEAGMGRKFKGKFDMGYEKLRDVIFANQNSSA